MIYVSPNCYQQKSQLHDAEVTIQSSIKLTEANASIASLGYVLEQQKNSPPTKFLVPGVKETSFGFVFGPPKSGKTIYMECMLLNIAAGRTEYMNQPLKPCVNRCLFISLEEGAKEYRFERNGKQLTEYSNEEMDRIIENFMVSYIEMPSHIVSNEHWRQLNDAIATSNASTVVIDSLNRLTGESLVDEEEAKAITKKLKWIVEENKIALFVINHTTKTSHEGIQSFSSMSGSRIYSSEADFMISVNRAENKRYAKLVISRYDEMIMIM